ncbi:isochorismate synthase [Priestia megaterium]|uniref:isochorismate synthase n=1 Tax=Priestia megaterium TaxID=1404 RepID=UPI002731505E|nr:isochorismate synthase [Priestia megaterium]MDP1442083.1 isochorismate synthase [Priestia megaterium]MDP1471140.1 isochorismate synthase [Priestia megaterium]
MTTTNKSLTQCILEGKEKSTSLQKELLITYSEQIKSINPISAFEVAKMQSNGRRFFWSNASRDLILVGFDKCFELENQFSHHFEIHEKKWDSLLDDSMTFPKNRDDLVGPMLLGGFCFDPLKPNTNLWREFPSSRLTLPKFMVIKRKDTTWFTFNMLVSKDTDEEVVVDNYMSIKEQILRESLKTIDDTSFLNVEYEEIDSHKWMETVDHAAHRVRLREIDKVVLARSLKINVKGNKKLSASSILNNLYIQQSSTYLFAIEYENDCFIGASPERLIESREDVFVSEALAGTTKRSLNKIEDIRLGNELLKDEKNLYEHKVVVDMIKKVMEETCYKVKMPKEPMLYKNQHIQHLYTPIKGYKRAGISLLTMIRMLHPTPAMNGYPPQKALRFIREKESLDRGWYASPIGWIGPYGKGEFVVGIRCGLIKDNEIFLFSGCGVVGDSESELEYEETKTKFLPMISAIFNNKL